MRKKSARQILFDISRKKLFILFLPAALAIAAVVTNTGYYRFYNLFHVIFKVE